ncbi:transmembrane protein 132C-like [Labeo rohita]|uniref:Transmembrane protein 132C-like n=1 Tax=Labeo rohita TaxID=84645 RepID=A0A498NLM8_LABRO|nr:transmembrane protein 132C-like [Labeo rohita]
MHGIHYVHLQLQYRVKLKDGVAFLGARPSNPTLWMVSQDVRTEGHRIVTLHCRRKESSYGQRDSLFHDSYQPSSCEKPWDKPRFSEIPKERINWKPNWMYKANQTARPRTTGVGKQRQNTPQHHSNIHGAKYPQEQHSLLSEDMEQVMKELKEFLENQLDTND